MREHINLMKKLNEMVNEIDEKLENLTTGQISSIQQKIGEILGVVERRKK